MAVCRKVGTVMYRKVLLGLLGLVSLLLSVGWVNVQEDSQTVLLLDMDATQSSASADWSSFPATGQIRIDDELMYFNKVYGLVRGQDDTESGIHEIGATITFIAAPINEKYDYKLKFGVEMPIPSVRVAVTSNQSVSVYTASPYHREHNNWVWGWFFFIGFFVVLFIWACCAASREKFVYVATPTYTRPTENHTNSGNNYKAYKSQHVGSVHVQGNNNVVTIVNGSEAEVYKKSEEPKERITKPSSVYEEYRKYVEQKAAVLNLIENGCDPNF